MRIVTKINITLAILAAGLLALDYGVLQFTVSPSFAEIETKAAQDNQTRVLEAVERMQEQLLASARDYATWDETYAFATSRSESYLSTNVTPNSLKALNANYFAVVDLAGNVIVDAGYESSDVPGEIHALGRDKLDPADPILAVARDGTGRTALITTREGLVAIAIAPILPSSGTGDSNGVLVLGRIVDKALLRATTRVNFVIGPAPKEGTPGAAVSVAPNVITVTSTITGIDGKPVAQLASGTRRTVTQLGRRALLIAVACVAVITLLLLGALGLLLKRLVIARLEAMRHHLRGVESSGRLSPFPADDRNDELSDLVTAFNRTTVQLADLRERLREADYRAGAADNAAGVIHNVRNGVTPIGVIAWDLLALDEAGWIESARKAIEELKRSDLDPERVAKLTNFLARAAERLLAQADNRKADLQKIQTLVRELNDLLRFQDMSSRYDHKPEVVSLDRALELSALIVQNRLGHSTACSIPAGIPAVNGNQLAVNQVFGNVFLNAAEAIEARQVRGFIAVAVESVVENGNASIDIAVTDNGEGVSADRLTTIFERGHSTRAARGSGGLGLHWCAMAVARMGGRMYAESPGVGLGTTIHVVLPSSETGSGPSAHRPMAEAA